MASRQVWHMPESVMRTKTFRTYDQDTLLLMPPSIRDWVDPEVVYRADTRDQGLRQRLLILPADRAGRLAPPVAIPGGWIDREMARAAVAENLERVIAWAMAKADRIAGIEPIEGYFSQAFKRSAARSISPVEPA